MSLSVFAILAIIISVFAIVFFIVWSWYWWRKFFCGERFSSNWNSNSNVPESLPRDPRVFLDPGLLAGPPDGINFDQSSTPANFHPEGSENENDLHAHDWFENNEHQTFPRTDVVYEKLVGKGRFGKVLEAKVANISPIQNAPIKAIVREQNADLSDRDQIRFLNDARFYRDVSHDNILKLLAHCIERSPYLLIYEIWPLGDLKSYLMENAADNGQELYNKGVLIRMVKDIAKGLEFIGQSGYVHGDLAGNNTVRFRTRNCLVGNEDGKVIIGDYGLAPQKYKDDYYWYGQKAWPIRWAAPESLRRNMDRIQRTKTTLKSNVWTFGIVLWEIFEMGSIPYPELNDEAVLEKVVSNQTYILGPPKRSFFTQLTQQTLHNIMLSCWNIDPDDRPTITMILGRLTILN